MNVAVAEFQLSEITRGRDFGQPEQGRGTAGWCATSLMPLIAMSFALINATVMTTTLLGSFTVISLVTPSQSQAGEWFACAIDAQGTKALVMGAKEVELDQSVPFQAKPSTSSPKVRLSAGSRAGRCYLNAQQQRALHSP